MKWILTLFLMISPADAADLVIIGDSISAPLDAGAWTTGQGYGAIIASRKGWTEVNLAVSGAKLSDMQSQWTAALARSPKPVGILSMCCSNDVYWQTDPVALQAMLDANVAAAVAAGVPVTLLTTFHRQIPTSWYASVPPYLQAVRAVGAKYNIVVVDVFAPSAELSLTNNSLFTSMIYTGDSINAHPNASGQAWIASLFQLPQYAAAVGYTVPPVPQIPVMTAATTNGVTITGNDLNSTGTTTSAPIWDIAASPAYSIQWNQSGAGWVSVQFPTAFVPVAYSIRARTEASSQAYAPKTRTLQGWNITTSVWDSLDQVTNEGAWSAGETRTRSVIESVPYSLFRVNVTSSQSGTYLQFRELQIYK